MNTIQISPNSSVMPGNLFFGPPARTGYIWKNLVIEKRISMNWAHKLFKGSIFHAFWTVWSSPVS